MSHYTLGKEESRGFTRSSKLIIYENQFDSKYKAVSVEPNHKIKDYPVIKDFELEHCLVYVNGFQKDENYILRDEDVCTIRQFSAGAVTAFIVVSTVLITYLAADNITKAVTGKHIHEHLNKALGWDKDDDLSLSTEGINVVERQTVTNVPSISGGKNQSQYGKPFPFVMGKSLYTPMYIGKPYTTISGVDGENEEFHALYVCGYNDIQISDIKLGNTLLSSNKEKITSGLLNIDSTVYPTSEYQTKIEVQDSDEVSLYPQKVIQQDFNIELINNYTSSTNQYFLQLDRFSSVFPQTVEVEFSIGGLLAYNNEGSVEISVKVAIEYSKDGGETWLPFAKIGEGQSGISYYADGSVQGVIKTDSGDKVFNGVSVIKRNKAKQMRFVARKTFSYNDIMDFDGNCTLTNNCIEFRIVRINGSYESGINQGVSGYNLQSPSDTVYLSSIRTWSFDRVESAKQKTLVPQRPIVESKRKRLTRLGFSIMAKETLKGTLDSFNCIVQSKGRVWDKYTGTWSTTVEPTQNPASIALLVLQSCMRGDINAANYIYDDSRIDLESFGKFYEWCDERGYYNSQDLETIRFACNGVLVSQKKTSDILKSVLACGRGVLVLNGKKYGVFIDKPRDITVMILNNQNILAASNTKTFDEIPDKFECAFVDERNNYSQDIGYAYLDESKRKTDVGDLKTETLSLPYQTNWYQVWSNLRYELACRKLRPETWSFTIGIEGNLLEYGDLVEVQSDSLLVGIGDGCQITNLIFDETNSYITGIETDGDFDVADASARYGVKIMETDASNNLEPKILTKEVTFSGTSGISKFDFVEPISLNELQLPYAEDIVAFGLYDRITSKGIVTSIKPDGEGRFSLVLVPYDENVFKADNKDYVNIPDFDSKLTPTIAVSRGGAVSFADLENIKNTVSANMAETITNVKDIVTVNKYQMDVSPEFVSVPCDVDGNIFDTVAVEFNVFLYYEDSQLSDGVAYEALIKNKVVGTWIDNKISIPVAEFKDNVTEIFITAAYGDITRKAIVTVSKLYSGQDATADWVQYDMMLSDYAIQCSNDGQLMPESIEPSKVMRTSEYQKATDYGTIKCSIDGQPPFVVGSYKQDETGRFDREKEYYSKFKPFLLSLGNDYVLGDKDSALIFYTR